MRTFIILLTLVPWLCTAQGNGTTTLTPGTIVMSSVDQLGNFYLRLSDGSLKKYDPSGKVMAEFSLPVAGSITLLECWNQLKVYYYQRGRQSYVLLDHYLVSQGEFEIDPSYAVDPLLVSPGANNTLWILDGADLSLKRVNRMLNRVELEMNLPGSGFPSQPDFVYLREYQNMIFLLERNTGIHVFSILGRPVNHIKASGLDSFNFMGEELYYLQDDTIQLMDLFSGETRAMKVSPGYSSAFVTDERIILLSKEKVELVAYDPKK